MAKKVAKPKKPRKSSHKFKFLKMGRPPAFETVEELVIKLDAYFIECKGKGRGWKRRPTKAGMARFLRVNIDTVNEYAKGTRGKDFSGAIKEAYLLIEEAWLEKLDQPYPTGGIFYLKNAYKDHYRDRYDHTNDGGEFPQPQIVVFSENSRMAEVAKKRAKQK